MNTFPAPGLVPARKSLQVLELMILNWRTRQDLQEAGGQPGPRGLLLHLPPQDEGLRSGVRPGRWVQQQRGPKVDTCHHRTWHSTVWVTMSVTVTMLCPIPNCLSDIARALVRTRSTRPSMFLVPPVISHYSLSSPSSLDLRHSQGLYGSKPTYQIIKKSWKYRSS